jgi:hypothetical protein
MHIGSGSQIYRWIDGWAQIPDTADARIGWAHAGVVVTRAGSVVTFHQSDPTVLMSDQAGKLLRSWDVDLTEGHGITLVEE